MASQSGSSQVDARPSNTLGPFVIRPEDLEIVTVKWLNHYDRNSSWRRTGDSFYQYLRAVRELEASTVLAFTIKANTEAIKHLANEMKILKTTVAKRTTNTPFKDALMRVSSPKKDFPFTVQKQ